MFLESPLKLYMDNKNLVPWSGLREILDDTHMGIVVKWIIILESVCWEKWTKNERPSVPTTRLGDGLFNLIK